jgi:hypothetical protein
VSDLGEAQFGADGQPATALGHIMKDLEAPSLPALSHMIRSNDGDRPSSPSWVQVYRELVEWAVLYSIVKHKEFATDTLIVCDGRRPLCGRLNWPDLRRM